MTTRFVCTGGPLLVDLVGKPVDELQDERLEERSRYEVRVGSEAQKGREHMHIELVHGRFLRTNDIAQPPMER